MSIKAVRFVCVAAALGISGVVAAASPGSPVQQSFTVNLTINAQCVVGSGTDINFTSQGFLASNVDAAGSFKVGCTKGTQPTITLDNGANSANCPNGGTRCMRRGTSSDYVNYNLYTDSNRNTLWTSSLSTTPVTGNGAVSGAAGVANQTVDVFGRVPAQDTGSPGDYTDTVTATVAF